MTEWLRILICSTLLHLEELITDNSKFYDYKGLSSIPFIIRYNLLVPTTEGLKIPVFSSQLYLGDFIIANLDLYYYKTL